MSGAAGPGPSFPDGDGAAGVPGGHNRRRTGWGTLCRNGADGFAWGVLAGAAMGPFALPLYGCLKARMRWCPDLSFRNADLQHYLWL